MQIWVDADACPKVIKEILFRAAIRTKILTTLVANKPLSVAPSLFIKTKLVAAGFDVADNYIVQMLQPNDLVITADIPLANEVIDKGGIALNPRGELYSKENIKQRLSIRDFNEQLRSSGININGPAALNKRDIQTFANCLDRLLVNR